MYNNKIYLQIINQIYLDTHFTVFVYWHKVMLYSYNF